MALLLVVEDSCTQAAEIRFILESAGFDVETAPDGQQAYERITSVRFDLVLSDIIMPGLSGYDLCRRIKANPERKDTPVILLTTLTGSMDIVLGLECGADNFITKPIEPDYLIDRVKEVLVNKTLRAGRSAAGGLELCLLGKKVTITSEREQILNLLCATFGELLRKNAELKSASQTKDCFLAAMSHELRTPLNAIIGFTGTLLMELPGPLNGDQQEQLQTIENSATHLLSLINDLLDLAKIESGKVELRREPVVCQAVVQEVLTTLRPMAEAKGLRLRAACPSEDLIVKTDRRALTQVLLNLTNNAIKFTEQGEVRIKVSRWSENGRADTVLSVSDTGIGIRPEDQARLFQAFEQVNGPGRGRQQGTGLGLHLSQKLAELLGGQITLQSKFGKGSTFTLVLKG